MMYVPRHVLSNARCVITTRACNPPGLRPLLYKNPVSAPTRTKAYLSCCNSEAATPHQLLRTHYMAVSCPPLGSVIGRGVWWCGLSVRYARHELLHRRCGRLLGFLHKTELDAADFCHLACQHAQESESPIGWQIRVCRRLTEQLCCSLHLFSRVLPLQQLVGQAIHDVSLGAVQFL